MAKLTIDQLDLRGKKVLLRCDFNVPLDENQNITDDRRISASLPTIEYALTNGAALVLCSHLGRPKGKPVEKMRLASVAKRLQELLKRPVQMAPDCVGSEVQHLKQNLKPGQVLLLENLRFHKQETDNDPDFSADLARGLDLFINDAFGTSHRAHASTEGVTHYFKQSAAGFLIEKELRYLGEAVTDPKRPLAAILGGAKISGKIDVIKSLFDKVDALLVGGGMAYTFYKAKGYEIGDSLLEEDKVELAAEILREAESRGVRMHLPVDVVIADAFANDAHTKVVPVTEMPVGFMGLDIGPESRAHFDAEIRKAKTIIWNGPVGVFEMPTFAAGTRSVAESIAQSTAAGAISIIGGGDSAAAISQFKMDDQFTHISTGGGASLEFLEGKTLPGIAALTEV